MEREPLRFGGWWWYTSEKVGKLKEHKTGKWMHFFTDQDFAKRMCQKAITEGACCECKCTDMELTGRPTGVICFYLNCDDKEDHRKVLRFMLDNNLIRRTKAGRLTNIAFKLDEQTIAGEYGSCFIPKITLSQFVDLDTGAWID